MRSVNMLNFSEALDKAKKTPDKPYMLRLSDLDGEFDTIDINNTRHFKYHIDGFHGNTPDITQYRRNEIGKFERKSALIGRDDLLACDYIDVSQWNFVDNGE